MAALLAGSPELKHERGASPEFQSARLTREWRTVAAMIHLYCRHHHSTCHGLCPECGNLLEYATARLQRCRFGGEKPTCAKCPVHCYSTEKRARIKEVMRFAGPRMLWAHPLLSLRHWVDSLKAVRR